MPTRFASYKTRGQTCYDAEIHNTYPFWNFANGKLVYRYLLAKLFIIDANNAFSYLYDIYY